MKDKIGPHFWWLLLGDWGALALFLLLGQLSHEGLTANLLPRLLRSLGEFLLPWTAVGLLWGAFRVTPAQGWRLFLGRPLTVWLVGAPLALLLRAYGRGQPTIIVVFMVITMGLGGAFLLGWRALYFGVARWRAARQKTAVSHG